LSEYEIFDYSENLNWAAQNLRLGRGLDKAGLNKGTSIVKPK